MERSVWILLVVITTLAMIHLVKAQSQQGFISLDCGLETAESPYNDSDTGLEYRSDATFIQSGKPGRVQGNLDSKFQKPYQTLRYFPKGRRNCYNLKVEKGRNHLIRATFLYGNYDGRNIGPKFDLYLGTNPWATIDLAIHVNGARSEMLYSPKSNSLQICLVKTGNTTPMISILEILPMGNDTYITESGSLKLRFRKYLSQSNPGIIRYPDDAYDRLWSTRFEPEWTEISTTRNVENDKTYEPPIKTLVTAAIPTNASEPLTIDWTNSDKSDDQYYFYSYFADIQDLQTNETREFEMQWNGEVFFVDPIIPEKFITTTTENEYPWTCDGVYCKVQLIRTNRSTLPPLLNAFEVYTVIRFSQNDTDENDVVAITSIKDAYGLNRVSWQGDPCVPYNFTWDGLNCSNTDESTTPRITSLNLSSTRLTGTIAAAIQNLTQLENLDLSNNNLVGELPEFLGNIKSLMFLNLSGNDLNGSIPQALRKKGLELLVEGNPRLSCLPDSCLKSPKKNFTVAIVASAVSAVVIAVLILLLFLRKKFSTENVTFGNNKGKKFKYSEVLKMTNNFQRVLGKGGFGMVYHGTVNGSQHVAVKVLSQSSTQGCKEFKAEVDLLLRVHRRLSVSFADSPKPNVTLS